MKQLAWKAALLTALAATAITETVAQPECIDPVSRVGVIARDHGTGMDTLWFGFDATATCGIDPHLCEYPSIFPPSGVFAASWVRPLPGDTCEPGYDRDYLAFVSRTTSNMHHLRYQPGEGGFPFTFVWNPADVRALCDSAVLADNFGGVFVRVRMDSVGSAMVTIPAISSLQLSVYGQKPAPPACAEPALRSRLTFSDNGAGRDTLWWAVGQGATCGLDTAMCEGGWEEPPPSGVFDVRFTGGTCTTGTHRAYLPEAFDRVDSVRIRLQPDAAGLPLTVRWNARPSGVWDVDSVILQDLFGGMLFRGSLRDSGLAQILNPAITGLYLLIFHSPLGVEDPGRVPASPELHQNYPNPFNPVTVIGYAVPSGGPEGTMPATKTAGGHATSLQVFDVLGRRVATLVDSWMPPGVHTATFDGTDLAGGVYFYRLTTGDRTLVRRMLLLK